MGLFSWFKKKPTASAAPARIASVSPSRIASPAPYRRNDEAYRSSDSGYSAPDQTANNLLLFSLAASDPSPSPVYDSPPASSYDGGSSYSSGSSYDSGCSGGGDSGGSCGCGSD